MICCYCYEILILESDIWLRCYFFRFGGKFVIRFSFVCCEYDWSNHVDIPLCCWDRMNFLNSNSCRPSIMCQGLGLSVFFFFWEQLWFVPRKHEYIYALFIRGHDSDCFVINSFVMPTCQVPTHIWNADLSLNYILPIQHPTKHILSRMWHSKKAEILFYCWNK